MAVSIRRRIAGILLAIGVVPMVLVSTGVPASAATVAKIKVRGSLIVRSAPSQSSPAVGRLRNGAKVSIACKVTGQYIKGRVRKTSQWDRLTNGRYVSHAYVNTRKSIRTCPPTPAPARAPAPAAPSELNGSMTQAQFIAAAAALAQRTQREYGVPASVTIAQAILESGWGKSGLTANDRNFFGMKCFTQGSIAIGCRVYRTHECNPDGTCYPIDASFRVYASALDSFRDHGRLLSMSSRYAAAFAYTKNPDQFIVEVHKGGYATSPTYATNIQNVMKNYNLYQYNL